jgi:hypothetical protein
MSYVCTLAHEDLWRHFGAKSYDSVEKSENIGKMYNHYIFIRFLDPCESSYDKCHRVSLLMSQTRFVCSFGHFGANTADF